MSILGNKGIRKARRKAIRETRSKIKEARKTFREGKRAGRQAVKRHKSGDYEYINSSEFRAFKAEGRSLKKSAIQKSRGVIKEIKKYTDY
tara:strand:+ start:43 stop:312 length:270 start_codon:yes stop_codon:yes gene_type:complete